MKHLVAETPSSLIVRTDPGQLRIVPVWQALAPHAAHAIRARIRCDVKNNVDEMTVTFDAVPVDALLEIAARLNAQPWVVTASAEDAPR